MKQQKLVSFVNTTMIIDPSELISALTSSRVQNSFLNMFKCLMDDERA
ncbi:uncharacterized protein CPUR_03431 [Claviceps purpurea 20.1]|uniref:Uncharacterized protein n=1 Tax=Claviceps purpurea (strain 20.1) TaxID=1111077 RepID=M1WDQ6_CLAP2|nr:uncharacterized protein CPUR_03431 [Claviceps purpurea 20.1]